MGVERNVRLFRDGKVQTVQIPSEFELPGEDAVMRKEGNKITIEPIRERAKSTESLLALLATLETLDEEFPEILELPLDPPPEFG